MPLSNDEYQEGMRRAYDPEKVKEAEESLANPMTPARRKELLSKMRTPKDEELEEHQFDIGGEG